VQLRAKMCDWMLEVLANFNHLCHNGTYFLSVAIMDLYFKKYRAVYPDSTRYTIHVHKSSVLLTPTSTPDVHITGVACMIIANKSVDNRALELQDDWID